MRTTAAVAVLAVLAGCAAGGRPVAPAPAGFAFRGMMSQGGMVFGTAPAGTVRLTLDGAAVALAPDRGFLIAFGRDHGPAAALASDGWRQPIAWPADGRITGAFGVQRVYNGERRAYHSGEDIAIPVGTPVRALADGVVLLAVAGTPLTLEGHLLVIGHGMGLDSTLLHRDRIDVKPGERIDPKLAVGMGGA